MKTLLVVLITLLSTYCYGSNKYIGAGGNNNNTGTSIATRWETSAKINTTSLIAGDTVFFARGEVFPGIIKPLNNGITFSAYGTGARPIISGFETLIGWTNVSGNIYETTPPIQVKDNVNILTINAIPYAVGRTPNYNSYYTYQSATTTTLTSSTLTGTPNYTGAEVVMKKNSFTGEKALITSQSGSVLTYTRTQGIQNNDPLPAVSGTADYGFFLQRFAGSLDQQGEWFYNKTTHKIQVYSTVNPSTLAIRATYIDTLMILGSHTSMTVENLAFEGAGMYAIESFVSTNVQVKNCTFNCNTKGIYFWNVNDAVIDRDTLDNSFNNAILVSNRQAKRITISNCLVTNTGLLIGMGLYWADDNLKGIVATDSFSVTNNYLNIIGNTVKNTGYSALQFQGSNVIVRRNITDTFCFNLDDGGGIYTFTKNSSLNTINYTNRLVDSNFISNAIGAPEGANGITDVVGLYLDDQAANITMKHNTIWNIPGPGAQMNTPHDNIFLDNTIYNCTYFTALNKRHVAEVYNNRLERNIMYQKVNTQYNLLHVDDNLTLPTSHTITQGLQAIAFIDTNWISNTKTNGFHYYYYSGSGPNYTFPSDFNLAAWQGTYGHELQCILPPVTVTNSNTAIYTNPSGVASIISFIGLSKIDPKGNTFNNSATIPPYSSLILIDNGMASTGGTTIIYYQRN